MLNQESHILDEFSKNFITGNIPVKRTILYGLGPNTELLLEKFSNYPFEGLLDGYQSDGTLYGKPILKLEDVAGKAERIIIVSRLGTQKIIFHRIAPYCKKHKIEIFSPQGCDLILESETIRDSNPYYDKTEGTLFDAINRHKEISFDIFGTLLIRNVWHPEDVFKLVSVKAGCSEIDFVRNRIKAEHLLSGHMVPNIYEIYELLGKKTGIKQPYLSKLLDLEIEIEKKVLKPRPAIVSMMRYALAQDKSVYLISDMYLPKVILEQILQKFNIIGYRDLMVSCEYGCGKEGGLYAQYKKEIQGSSYLHIGDDEETDGIYANLYGIDSYLIKNPCEILEISPARIVVSQPANLMVLLERGKYAAGAFGDPFVLSGSNGRLKVSTPYELGYLYIAPIITEFVFWLIARLAGNKFRKICFISRDGFLIEKLYKLAIKHYKNLELPPSEYLYTSRSLCVHAAITDQEDLEHASGLPFDGCPETLLEKRFHLRRNEIIPYDEHRFGNTKNYILAHAEPICRVAGELRSQYLNYLDCSGTGWIGKTAIFDFVSTGTCQMCLEKILNISMEGLYFSRITDIDQRKKSLNIKDFTTTFPETQKSVCDNYFLLENLIKEPGPSVSHIDKEGKVVYCKDYHTLEQHEKIEGVQQAVINYFTQLIESGFLPDDYLPENGIGGKLLSLINKKYMDAEKTGLFSGLIVDEFYNRYIQLALL